VAMLMASEKVRIQTFEFMTPHSLVERVERAVDFA
jgi:hypothetical protein